MRAFLTAITLLGATLPATAQVCNPSKFGGAYGFQLTGSTNISGSSKPVSSMGRLDFDGSGAVSGTASVNFDGLLLGNPVTGTYEVRTDCTIEWSLQDTSGAFQHFTGHLAPDFTRASFHQTDPGGARDGTLAMLSRECSAGAIRGNYQFSVSGTIRPMDTDGKARKVSLQGQIAADQDGNLVLLRGGTAVNAGTVTVDSDCIVEMHFIPSPGDQMTLRGVLVSEGKEILAIDADPGAAVNARFTMR